MLSTYQNESDQRAKPPARPTDQRPRARARCAAQRAKRCHATLARVRWSSSPGCVSAPRACACPQPDDEPSRLQHGHGSSGSRHGRPARSPPFEQTSAFFALIFFQSWSCIMRVMTIPSPLEEIFTTTPPGHQRTTTYSSFSFRPHIRGYSFLTYIHTWHSLYLQCNIDAVNESQRRCAMA